MEVVEYRSVIKFLVMKNLKCQDVIKELMNVYEDKCPSSATIKYWFREFKSGRLSVFDAERTGRPQEINDTMEEKIKNLIIENRKMTTRVMCEFLNISKGTLYNKLKEMGIRKLCSRFVPRLLTGEMMNNRRIAAENNLKLYEELGDDLINNIITQDETPLSLYIPSTKAESKEWTMPGEKPAKKLKVGLIHRKSMILSTFWDRSGLILMDFTELDTKIDSEYFSNLVRKARKLRRKQKIRHYGC